MCLHLFHQFSGPGRKGEAVGKERGVSEGGSMECSDELGVEGRICCDDESFRTAISEVSGSLVKFLL